MKVQHSVLFLALLTAPVMLWIGARLGSSSSPDPGVPALGPTPAGIDLSNYRTGLKPGDDLPIFVTTDARGSTTDIQALLRGEAAILLYVSTTCPPCLREIDRWNRFVTEFDPAIRVFAVAPDGVEQLTDFASTNDLALPVLSDFQGALMLEHRVSILPTVFGVDASGRIAFLQQEFDPELEPERVVAAVLAAEEKTTTRWAPERSRAGK